MPRSARCFTLLPAILLFAAGLVHGQAAEQPVSFELTFSPAVTQAPFTGRVLLFLQERSGGEPRFGPNWFRPQPFYAMTVKDWQPDTPLIFQPMIGFPVPIERLSPGSFAVQAVMDLDLGGREVGNSPGNGYSEAFRIFIDPAKTGKLKLRIDQVVRPRKFTETARVKLFEIESRKLTAFHGRPIRLRAGVALPDSYAAEPNRRYPIIYDVPGFGGNHFGAYVASNRNLTRLNGEDFLYVVLDPDCRTGHHVFADSANNGPCGAALTEELIPALEEKFRAIGKPGARFVTGHSSGGWSSLWLQITYPDIFGGCWSTAPDPVDFRDFQRINLYQPGTNMFRDEQGQPRPLARSSRGETAAILYKNFSDMEEVLGRGGQLMSFEAVFSPKGQDGQPKRLWDRQTGEINGNIAKAWEAYDINLVIRKNWPTLGPKLRGKVRVYMGERDTFFLEGAARLLKQTFAELGSDAVVELFPGKDHGSLLDFAMQQRLAKEMAQQYRIWRQSNP